MLLASTRTASAGVGGHAGASREWRQEITDFTTPSASWPQFVGAREQGLIIDHNPNDYKACAVAVQDSIVPCSVKAWKFLTKRGGGGGGRGINDMSCVRMRQKEGRTHSSCRGKERKYLAQYIYLYRHGVSYRGANTIMIIVITVVSHSLS